jgi:type VI secretion system protein ImpI
VPRDIGGVRIDISCRGGLAQPFVLARFPVRLGRNPLNEVHLDDPHVSQWHAILGDIEGAIRLVDVGSRNGTWLGDRRLAAGQAVPLRGGEAIRIGPFSLQIDLLPGAVLESRPAAVAQPAFAANLAPGESTLADGPLPGALPKSAEEQAARETALLAELQPRYLEFLRGWAALCSRARQRIAALPANRRPVVLDRLRKDFPIHSWEEEFPELSASAARVGVPPLALQLGQRVTTDAEAQAFSARLEEIVKVFVEHTHNLLQGVAKLESNLALRLQGRETNPLLRARDARDLLARLFDTSTDAPTWLASAYKSVMIQQVALLSGAMKGIRTILSQLSPESIEKEVGGSRNAFGMRAKALWRAFVEKHQKLSEENPETFEAIFGADLARAYIELFGAAE